MAIVDVNIRNRHYDKLLKFLKERKCEILLDDEMMGKYHMMKIKTVEEEDAWDILARTFLRKKIDTDDDGVKWWNTSETE